jgi:hypothetical protein
MSRRGGFSAAAAVASLAKLRFGNAFNPYSDVCGMFDEPAAPDIRRANLLATLEIASRGVDELWMALEPGHRGARRTGLAMTDDRHLSAHSARWELPAITRATVSGPETELTAGIVWEALSKKRGRILLWNVFPLHCHNAGNPLSNRRHTREERHACSDLTRDLISMVSPRRILAIGNDAHSAMDEMGLDCVKVRHPARGGKAAFLREASK